MAERAFKHWGWGYEDQQPDRAALEAYQKHERHVPVAQLGASLCEHVVAVDFMV